MPSHNPTLQDLLDREAIRTCLLRYCRGMDRCDEALLHSVYWPDATESHAMPGRPPINAYHFIERVLPKLRRMDQSQHFLGNMLIETDGDEARAETYFQAHHRLRDRAEPRDVITAGRYLDRLQRRNGEWRIFGREVAIDWFRELDDSADWERGTFGGPCVMGTRHPDDLSYQWLGALFGTGAAIPSD